jgi:protein-tyrosine phosphatase
MKILMVCLGNICRSPLAEGILQKKLAEAGLNWMVDSAGTNGYHVGESPHHLSQKVAKINGVDISNQVARKFRMEDLDEFDRIYIMADDVLEEMRRIGGLGMKETNIKLFLEELYPGQNKEVPDPWYGDEDGYHEVYELIEKNCDAIIENYLITTQQTIQQ